MVNGTETVKAAAAAGSLTLVMPLLSDYALILTAAVFGAFVAASRIQHPSRRESVLWIFRAVAISAFSAGAAAQTLTSDWLQNHTGMQIGHTWQTMAFVAFWIAVIGDGWFKAKDWAIYRLKGWLNARIR